MQIETYEHRNQIFIVMELCAGGDLYSRDPYTEAEAARIVSSILSAISYMHSKNICHRDLSEFTYHLQWIPKNLCLRVSQVFLSICIEYENILFINDHPKAEIKLIDFGLSKKFGKEELTEGVGTM